MARRIPVPTVEYRQVDEPDDSAIDAVFDYLFDLLLKCEAVDDDLASQE